MSQSAFVLRIAPSGNDRVPEALEKDQLIIGWADATGLLNEALEWEAFREIVHSAYHAAEPNYRRAGAAAGHIWRFIRGMKPGDLVVVPSDIDTKLRGVAAELHAAINMSSLGFSEFEIVMAGSQASPDFIAWFNGQRTRIEVKNLREPKDYIRVVASDQWSRRCREQPDRYRFRVALWHANQGPISSLAERRLRAVIDQLPESTRQKREILDGGVEVCFERIAENQLNLPTGMNSPLTGPPGQLVVVSPIMAQHFEFEVSELQALFLKAIRVVADAQAKFFGKETSEPGSLNVFALRWETPEPFFDPTLMEEVQERIQQLYASFELPLRVIIFAGLGGPEIPMALLNRFR